METKTTLESLRTEIELGLSVSASSPDPKYGGQKLYVFRDSITGWFMFVGIKNGMSCGILDETVDLDDLTGLWVLTNFEWSLDTISAEAMNEYRAKVGPWRANQERLLLWPANLPGRRGFLGAW